MVWTLRGRRDLFALAVVVESASLVASGASCGGGGSAQAPEDEDSATTRLAMQPTAATARAAMDASARTLAAARPARGAMLETPARPTPAGPRARRPSPRCGRMKGATRSRGRAARDRSPERGHRQRVGRPLHQDVRRQERSRVLQCDPRGRDVEGRSGQRDLRGPDRSGRRGHPFGASIRVQAVRLDDDRGRALLCPLLADHGPQSAGIRHPRWASSGRNPFSADKPRSALGVPCACGPRCGRNSNWCLRPCVRREPGWCRRRRRHVGSAAPGRCPDRLSGRVRWPGPAN